MSSREMKKITKRKTRKHFSEEEEEENKKQKSGQKRFKIERKGAKNDQNDVKGNELDEAREPEEKIIERSTEDEAIYTKENLPKQNFAPVTFDKNENKFAPATFEEKETEKEILFDDESSSNKNEVAISNPSRNTKNPQIKSKDSDKKDKSWQPLFSSEGAGMAALQNSKPVSRSQKTDPVLKDTRKMGKPKAKAPSLKSTQRLSMQARQKRLRKQGKSRQLALHANKFGTPQHHSHSNRKDSLKATEALARQQKISLNTGQIHENKVKSHKFSYFAAFLILLCASSAGIYFARPFWNKNNFPYPPKTTVVTEKIDKSLGWFGEKIPSSMIRGKKVGEYIWKKDNSVMVYVQPGAFWYGKKKKKIHGYYIDKYELTNKQYKRFIKETERTISYSVEKKFRKPNYPVVGISHSNARMYAAWAGKRLPTNYEWVKAARGGLEVPDWENGTIRLKLKPNRFPKRNYPWGKFRENRANYTKSKDGYLYTAPVGAFPKGASPYGCLDMAGNVWEWCESKKNTSQGGVCRGGSWSGKRRGIDYRFKAKKRSKNIGVRFVYSPK